MSGDELALAEGATRRFGDLLAVDDIDLEDAAIVAQLREHRGGPGDRRGGPPEDRGRAA